MRSLAKNQTQVPPTVSIADLQLAQTVFYITQLVATDLVIFRFERMPVVTIRDLFQRRKLLHLMSEGLDVFLTGIRVRHGQQVSEVGGQALPGKN